MNLQWSSFFEKDKTIKEQISEAMIEVERKPFKLSGLFWFFFLQICIAMMLMIFSILLPIWILYA